MGVKRTIRNDVVADHAASIVGEGDEQRVGLTDAEAAELDVSVVDAGASVRRKGEAAAFLVVGYAVTIKVNLVGRGVGGVVKVDLCIATQSAELGFRTGIYLQSETSTLVVGVVVVEMPLLTKSSLSTTSRRPC